jgi:hypothetical protein
MATTFYTSTPRPITERFAQVLVRVFERDGFTFSRHTAITQSAGGCQSGGE